MSGIDIGNGWRWLIHIAPRLAYFWHAAVNPVSPNHLEKRQIMGNKCPFQQKEGHLLNESAVMQMVS